MSGETLSVVVVAVLATSLVLLRQAQRLRAMSWERTQGDEIEYVHRALGLGRYEGDALLPVPYLRPPLMTLWLRLLFVGVDRSLRLPPGTELPPAVPAWNETDDPPTDLRAALSRARVAVAVLAGLVVGVAVLLAGSLAGWLGAVSCAGVLVLLEERATLAVCIWPDALMAASTLAVTAALSAQAENPLGWWWIGIATACASLTRIDGLALAVGASAAWWQLGRGGEDLVAIWAPPLLTLGIWTARCGLRYGIFLPDTTFAFNLLVLANSRPEAGSSGDRGRSASTSVEKAVETSWRIWTKEAAQGGVAARQSTGRLIRLLASPWPLFTGWLGRVRRLFGPDSFGREIVLDGLLYPDPQRVRHWRRRQFWQVPFLVAVLFGSSWLVAGTQDGWSVFSSIWPVFLPALALALAATAAHTRTRYRFALLPPLAILLGIQVAALAQIRSMADPMRWLTALLVIVAVFLLLSLKANHEVTPRGASS